MTVLEKVRKRKIRHLRVRKKVFGTPGSPRLCIFKSNRYVSCQLIDDEDGRTLVAASSMENELKEKLQSTKSKEAAVEVGKLIAERAKKSGIKKVVFDRTGHKYHGRVKALAEAAREAGLEF